MGARCSTAGAGLPANRSRRKKSAPEKLVRGKDSPYLQATYKLSYRRQRLWPVLHTPLGAKQRGNNRFGS